ncbi:hypothetical protein A2866_04375 [Candidatus Roizmanbacteria bacterium RIFCSPHIGHO2_01_FULL_39_8]|uniref:methionyl-tRNA formyltransferase n=3 Tax=Candidatus Roizmaniibacteriota TaxID=1752723 RepID=A0A1F7GJU6_9BACT|nr:MAG: hypothetical protein A2866_04375 [Candidatus Roizmanbacteria bacterium RIFCSPHIGHO2_01_FULL_39_8]OGK26309.1 MAG: hypothetical protein A3C28_02210 [Candidatus Roizmanbacteria bacterium RIFCSPHIGHO2_02_FULL_39_9]OGK35013.1 MAG: hypothetical protein A3F60_02555 [Candidatus Roizmanbacteria bacterium RIFCSPHIGHO2_12_FULL_39_8]
MKKLSLAYFGTPYFSAKFLEKLLSDAATNQSIEVKLVVTQPDAPVGRKHILTPTPVKVVAKKYGIKVLDNLDKLQATSYKLKEIDMAFLFAYGNLIPNDLLRSPKYGFWNTHPSLLPLYRGPAPVAYPLIMGDAKTGMTLIQLDKEIDHGPVIAQEETEILPGERRSELELKLTDLAFNLFKKQMNALTREPANKLVRQPQQHPKATFTDRLEKSNGFIPYLVLKNALQRENNDWKPKLIEDYLQTNRNIQITNYPLPITIFNLFRGLYPWPGIWTSTHIKGQEKRLKLTDMDLVGNQLILKKVQLEGKKQVDFKTFQSAYHAF